MSITLTRPCDAPAGAKFLQQGPRWRYHFDITGKWTKLPEGVHGYHSGRDLVAPIGTPLVSPIDGKVLVTGWQDPQNSLVGFGLRVILEGTRSVESFDGVMVKSYVYLAHLSEIFVVAGAMVYAGSTHIGLSGMTGNSTGPHLHVEVADPRWTPRRPLPFEWKS